MRFTAEERTFLEKRIVSLQTEGGFEGSDQRRLTQAIQYLNVRDPKAPITLYIDCTGGRLHAQNSLVDTIQMSRAPIHGVVVGIAASSAFNILQLCDVRKAFPNSELMCHALGPPGTQVDHPRFKKTIARSLRQKRKLIALISLRSGQAPKRIARWIQEQKEFTAKKALKCGLIDEIVPYERGLPSRRAKKAA